MMHLHRLKTRGTIKISPLKRLGIMLFVGAIAFSLISTIWAIYLDSFLKNAAYVGLFSALITFVSFVSYFLIIPLVESSNKIKLSVMSSILIMVGYFSYNLIEKFSLLILVALIVTIAATIRITCNGLLIRHNSKTKELAKNEGMMYTIANLAYLIGPLLAGIILSKYGLNTIFLVAAGFLLLSSIITSFSKLKDLKIKKKIDNDLIRNFKEFFKNKERVKIYSLSAGITFWWSLIFIYLPLMIIRNLNNSYVGYFLFLIAVPLILFEYPFGKLAGKKGYKKLFVLGFAIPGILALSCFFYTNIWFVMIAMIVSSIGLAMIESTTESYFFDTLKGEQDQKYYAPYNTAIDTGNLLGELVAGLTLLVLSMKFVFLVYSVGMFILVIVALKTKNIIESKRKE